MSRQSDSSSTDQIWNTKKNLSVSLTSDTLPNRILIIDDDATTCFLHKRLLQDMQIAQEVDYMTDAPTALQHVKERYAGKNTGPGPDLILLDLDMPVMSGLLFLKELDRLPLDRSKLFVVMLTASLDPQDRQKAEQMPFELDGFQVKPLNKAIMDELLAHISQRTTGQQKQHRR